MIGLICRVNWFLLFVSIVRALDEQFYYRAAGGELTRRYSGRGAGALRLETRLFGE
jgi:hypothetical protein